MSSGSIPLAAKSSRGQWAQGWRSFRRNALALAGGVSVLLLVLIAVLGPIVTPTDPIYQFRDGTTEFGAPLPPDLSGQFPFGTDNLGRDVLTRLIHGARISLIVGVFGNGLALIIGIIAGGIAAYTGGAIETTIMRGIDIVMSFPLLLLAIALSAVLTPGLSTLIIVIAFVYWTGMARVIYGEVLSLRQQEFITAARCVGAPTWRILGAHFLPNLVPVIIVYATLGIATTIRVEATLSYLGVGVPPPAPSWGSMMNLGQAYFQSAPWLVLIPGVAVVLTVLAFNSLGEGLRDALDPLRRTRRNLE